MVRFRAEALITVAVIAAITVLPARASALTSDDNTPFPPSPDIAGARWTSARHGPPGNQWGDILPTPWADDGNLYVLIDDGGIGTHGGARWRNSFGRIIGTPPRLRFTPVGTPPPPATWPQIRRNRQPWTGPLGSYYSTGFAIVDNVFYATQLNDWNWGPRVRSRVSPVLRTRRTRAVTGSSPRRPSPLRPAVSTG